MKQAFFLITSVFVIFFSDFKVQAQQGVDGDSVHPLYTQPLGRNMLTYQQFKSIKYNNYTIQSLIQISDDQEILSEILGPISSKEISEMGNITYYFGTNTLHFKPDEQEISTLELKDNTVGVSILSKTIRVGDSFETMKQKFGNNLKILSSSSINSSINVSFNTINNTYDGFIITVNSETLKISEIAYYIRS